MPITAFPINTTPLPNLTTSVMATAFDARVYGATGDGTTDNSAAIQAALNAASVIGNASVWLPSGTYIITTALSIPAGVTLRGDNAIIRRSGVASGALITMTASNAGLEGLILDGGYTANSDTAELGWALVELIGASDATAVANISLWKTKFRRSRACGLRIIGNVDGLIVEKCESEMTFCSIFGTYYNTSAAKIYRNVTIRNNRFRPNWASGQYSGAVKLVSDDSLTLHPENLIISGNEIDTAGEMGVELWKLARHCVIRKNTITGCEFGISVDKADDVLIEGNHCTRFGYTGIEIAQACNNITAADNVCIGYDAAGDRDGSSCLVISGAVCTKIRIKDGIYMGSNKGMQIQNGDGVEIDNASITDCGELLFLQGADSVWAHEVKLHGPCQAHLVIDCASKDCADIDIDGCLFTGAAAGDNIGYYDLGNGYELENLRIHNCNAVAATWGNLSINKGIPLIRTPNVRCYDNYFIGGANRADFSAFSDSTATAEPFAPSLQRAGLSIAGKATITVPAGAVRWAKVISHISGNVFFAQLNTAATNTTNGDSSSINALIAGAPYNQGASITAMPGTQFGGIVEEIIYNNSDATHEVWVKLKASAYAWTVTVSISDYATSIIGAPALVTTEPTWATNLYKLSVEFSYGHMVHAPALFARDCIASSPRGAITELGARHHVRGPGASGLAATRVARYDKADGAEAFGVKDNGEALAKFGLSVGDDGHTATIKRILSNSGTLDWGTINAGDELTLHLYVAGVLPTNNPAVALGWVALPPAGIVVRAAQVNPSTETVSISLHNQTAGNITVGNLTVRATVFQY